MERRRLTISLEPEEYEALVHYAESNERSLNWVVKHAVKKFLSSEDPQIGLPLEPEHRRGSSR